MNEYIKNQCQNMIRVITVFEQACELAAKQDDGVISKAEETQLRRIRAAAKAFKKELNHIC